MAPRALREYLTGRELMLYEEGFSDGVQWLMNKEELFRAQGRPAVGPAPDYIPRTEEGPYTREAYAQNIAMVKSFSAKKKLSRWNRYVKKKANRIYLKGKKNKLNFKLMGKKYRRKYGIKK